jgi:hypothetical protein
VMRWTTTCLFDRRPSWDDGLVVRYGERVPIPMRLPVSVFAGLRLWIRDGKDDKQFEGLRWLSNGGWMNQGSDLLCSSIRCSGEGRRHVVELRVDHRPTSETE